MKIAIASGKGGTGKTTVAVNLAHSFAAQGEAVQYLDCDVEEPNGHIFLKPDIEETQNITIGVPEVDTELCNGCGKCGELCQYSAIICLKDKAMTFEQLCHSCGGCMLVCPTGAIKEKQNEIGFVELGRANGVAFGQGRLKIGDVHSPTLIKRVKERSLEGHVAIIDAPPGTSCPVVEAIQEVDFVLLVTEPTPFGLNDLKLAVDLVRKMNLPFAVAINRYDIGDDGVEQYCNSEEIEIALKLPDDRRIAEAYSTGQIIVDVLSEYRKEFSGLHEYIMKSVKAGIDDKR